MITKNGISMADSGTGNKTVPVSGNVNEGIDRSAAFTITAGDKTKNITVNQAGLREVFNASDGSFLLSDGTTFNVLKQ